MPAAKLPKDEQARRNALLQDEREDSLNASRLIFMTVWLKNRGASKEKIFGLVDWSDKEKDLIAKSFRRVN